MVHWCHLCNRSRNVVKTKVQRIYIYIYTTNQTLPPSICILSLIQEFRLLLFSMQLWVTVAVLGLLVRGSWAQGVMPTFSFPPCDSPEAEAAALVAQDFLNAQHTHGYKHALNQIEKIKILSQPGHTDMYLLELDLLETTCHVLDPTPVSLCPVRQKHTVAVEADCDFALTNTTQGLSVVAFKCKTETESEEECIGCPSLVLFNDTDGLQLIENSLDSFNKKNTLSTKFALLEIGRMASQIVSGGPKYFAEYAIIGTNCTSYDDDICFPQNHTVAIHGLCLAEGSANLNDVDCKIFSPTQTVDPASNATVRIQKLLHAHTFGPIHHPTIHDLRHHKLTALHDPAASGLLSAESAESAEVVVVVPPKEAPVVKREVSAPEGPAVDAAVVPEGPAVDAAVVPEGPAVDAAVVPEGPALDATVMPKILLPPICPGKKKHF